MAASILLALAIALFAYFALSEVPHSLRGQPDFPNYYIAGERLRFGEPLYDEVHSEVIERFGTSSAAYPADPPPTVVLLAPLSLLPYEAAWLTLAAISTLLVPLVTYRVARESGLATHWAVIAMSLALVSTNFRFLIMSGHMESLILLAGYLGWRSLREGSETKGGIWWGAAAALKLFPGMWLVGLAAARRSRAVAGGIAAVALILTLGVAVVGLEESWRYVTDVVPRSERWYGALGNYSVLSFGTALVGNWFGWILTIAVGAAGLAWFVRRPGQPDRIWSAGIALALLLSPLAWHNYMVLTFPALVILGSRADLRSSRNRLGFAALVGALAFWGPVVVPSELATVLLSFVPTYALAALFVVSMRQGATEWSSKPEKPSLISS